MLDFRDIHSSVLIIEKMELKLESVSLGPHEPTSFCHKISSQRV